MPSFIPRRLRKLSTSPGAVEFGPLGSVVKWRKPLVGSVPLPPGVAVFKSPTGVRVTGGTDARARRAGAVLTSDKPMPEVLAKASGYGSSASLTGALKRHEIVHSIQAAKRGYRTPSRIRDVVKDEIGAYATMNRGVTGGSKIVRGINTAIGVPASVAVGVLNNPRLRKRAAVYGAGAAALIGGGLAVKKLREERKDMRAETARVRALSARIGTKLANFATPARDPKTGAFTVGGGVTAKALRKAWRIPSPSLGRIPVRQPVKAVASALAGSSAPTAFRAALVSALSKLPARPVSFAALRPVVAFSALEGIGGDSVDKTNAVIRGVSVLTSGLVARGYDLAVDAVTLTQMLKAAKARETVPVKIDHGSGAAAVCGYLDKFRIEGTKLKADWRLLKTHPQTAQILEVASVMPAGVGLSASFLPPPDAERGKARCAELLSVDYVTLPAANPDGLFSARMEDAATTRRKNAFAKTVRVAGAGVLGAVGAASIAARGIDRVSSLGLRRLQPSPKLRAGLIGAAGALGAAQTVRAVLTRKPRPAYSDPREMAASFRAALVHLGIPHEKAAYGAAALTQAEHEEGVPRVVFIKPRHSLGKRVAIRAAKVGIGAAGGAYIGRKLGTAAGAATGAAAGLLFQSRARSFASPDPEERPGLLRRAAGAAALAGAAYGGLSYLRGRRAGAVGILPALKAGNAANVASLRKIIPRASGLLTGRPAVGLSTKIPPRPTPARVRALLLQLGRRLRRIA